MNSALAVAALIISSLASLAAFIAAARQFTKGYIARRVVESDEHRLIKKLENNLRLVQKQLGIAWDDSEVK